VAVPIIVIDIGQIIGFARISDLKASLTRKNGREASALETIDALITQLKEEHEKRISRLTQEQQATLYVINNYEQIRIELIERYLLSGDRMYIHENESGPTTTDIGKDGYAKPYGDGFPLPNELSLFCSQKYGGLKEEIKITPWVVNEYCRHYGLPAAVERKMLEKLDAKKMLYLQPPIGPKEKNEPSVLGAA